MTRAIILLVLLFASTCAAQNDTTFTYQGELKQNGELADGEFNMTFSVWDAEIGGTQVSATIFQFDVPVNDGRFSVDLDFGADVFNNADRWLQIRVGATTLAPRVTFTRAPYSIQTRGIQVADDGRVGIGVSTPPSNISLAVAAGSNNHAMQTISANANQATFFSFNAGGGPSINAQGKQRRGTQRRRPHHRWPNPSSKHCIGQR